LGIDIQEASAVDFKNVKVFSEVTNPCVDVINSDNISFEGMQFSSNAELGFRIAGDRNASLKISKTDFSKVKEKYKLEPGVSENVIDVH
jgi:hypothetical protein